MQDQEESSTSHWSKRVQTDQELSLLDGVEAPWCENDFSFLKETISESECFQDFFPHITHYSQ